MNLNNIYFADIENPPFNKNCTDNNFYRPSYICMKNIDKKVICESNELDTFMREIKHNNCIVYFHNLKYDGTLIVYWLKHNKEKYEILMCKMGSIYLIRWGDIEFRCSFKLLLNSVKNLGKMVSEEKGISFNKGEYDYTKIGHYPTLQDVPYKLVEYCQRDIDIVIEAFILLSPLLEMEGRGLPLTLGQKAFFDIVREIGMKQFRENFVNQWWPKHISEPPYYYSKKKKVYHPIEDKTCKPVWFDAWYDSLETYRRGFKGGITLCNPKYKCTVVKGEIHKDDMRSAHPASMEKPLPFGECLLKRPQGAFITFINITIHSVKKVNKDAPAFLYVNSPQYQEIDPWTGAKLPYLHGELKDVTLKYIFLKEEFDLLKKVYHFDYTLNETNYYKAYSYCNSYVQKHKEGKNNSTGAKRTFHKLMLNAGYGKFAQNKVCVGSKEYILNEEGALKFSDPWYEYSTYDGTYLPAAMVISARSRIRLIEACLKMGDRWLYMDTDCIVYKGEVADLDRHPTNFGAWVDETIGKPIVEFYCGKPKYYGYKYVDEKTGKYKIEYKIAGVRQQAKEELHWQVFTDPYKTLTVKHLQICTKNHWACLQEYDKTIWTNSKLRNMSNADFMKEVVYGNKGK